jgi:hypothetical protein
MAGVENAGGAAGLKVNGLVEIGACSVKSGPMTFQDGMTQSFSGGLTKGICMLSFSGTDEFRDSSTCVWNVIALSPGGTASITAEDVDNGSTDNCCAITKTVSQDAFDCDDAGASITVDLTVADGSGDQAACQSSVTVVDESNPAPRCQQEISVTLSSTEGTASIAAEDVDFGSTDDRGTIAKSIS